MKLNLENIEAIFLAHTEAEARKYSKINDILAALSSFSQEVRSMYKHGDPDAQFKTPTEAINWCRDRFYCALADYNIDLDDF